MESSTREAPPSAASSKVSGCEVNIDGDRLCQIADHTQKKLAVALKVIGDLIQTVGVGKIYLCKVAEVLKKDGAFIAVLPSLDGLLHGSEIAHHRVANPSDELNEGQEIIVKSLGIDERSGKINLSRKAPIPKPEGAEDEHAAHSGEEARRERRPQLRRS